MIDAARGLECSVGALVMDDAATGAHPLRIPRTHRAGVAEAVEVPSRARQQVGEGLDAGVGMGRRALGLARAIGHRPEMIEHDEGAHGLQAARWNRTADFEAFAFEQGRRIDRAFDMTRRELRHRRLQYSEGNR